MPGSEMFLVAIVWGGIFFGLGYLIGWLAAELFGFVSKRFLEGAMTTDNQALPACPFCGSNDLVVGEHCGEAADGSEFEHESVECLGCNASAPYERWKSLPAPLTNAATSMLQERRRQVEKEGYDPSHDDDHESGVLAAAAGCYLLYSDAYPNAGEPPHAWPWEDHWWKPKDFRRDLERAGALILAELERMDRANQG